MPVVSRDHIRTSRVLGQHRRYRLLGPSVLAASTSWTSNPCSRQQRERLRTLRRRWDASLAASDGVGWTGTTPCRGLAGGGTGGGLLKLAACVGAQPERILRWRFYESKPTKRSPQSGECVSGKSQR